MITYNELNVFEAHFDRFTVITVFPIAVDLLLSFSQFLPAGLQRVWGQLNAKIAGGQSEIRRFIAYTEIFLMAVVIWNAFM